MRGDPGQNVADLADSGQYVSDRAPSGGQAIGVAERTGPADLPHLHAFTRGLDLDKEAVHAAVTLPYLNGGTEGVNTKTKRIMRQMHGRASFALLRHRILLG